MDGYIKGVQPHYYSGKTHSGISFYVFLIGNFKDWEYQVLSRMWNAKTFIYTLQVGVLSYSVTLETVWLYLELKMYLSIYGKAFAHPCLYPREIFLYTNQETCTKMLPEALFAIAKANKQTKPRSNSNIYHNTRPSNNENKPIVASNTKDAFQECKLE